MADHEFPPAEGGSAGFEQRVQQKMAGMELAPSGEVWEKVDLKLHPENKRRRWLIWLFFLLAGLGLGGYTLWNYHSQNIKQQLITNDKFKNSPKQDPSISSNKTSPETSNQNKSGSIDTGRKSAAQNDNSTLNTPGDAATVNDAVPGPLNKVPAPAKNRNLSGSKSITTNERRPSLMAMEEAGLSVQGHLSKIDGAHLLANNQKATTEAANILTENNEEIETVATRNPEPVIVTTTIILGSNVNTALGLTHEHPLATTSKIKLKPKNRLAWGLTLAGGRSAASSGAINSLFRSSSQADFLNASPITNGNGGGNGNINLPTPSTIKAGPAFKVGVFAKKQLTPGLSISAGLNYSLYTLSNKVGQKVDSSVNFSGALFSGRTGIDQYFRTGNTQKYVSRFHFIELPVLLHAGLKNQKIPLSFDFGFSVSRLIASNAVHYNASSGIYYKDNDLLNKTQFNLITGIPIRLFSIRAFSFNAGPHFQYGVTNLLSDKNTGEKHFIFLGVKAGILLRKK